MADWRRRKIGADEGNAFGRRREFRCERRRARAGKGFRLLIEARGALAHHAARAHDGRVSGPARRRATVPTRLRRTARSNSRRSRLPSSAASPARSRRRSMSRPSVAASSSAEGDDGAPELPDYDVVQLGPLETSAVALGARGWLGGSDDANAYVAAIDRGFLLLAAHAPSELALLKEYERYWKLSEAAQLPGARTPRVYAIVEVGAGGSSVADAVPAHALAAGGAEPDLFCFRLAPRRRPRRRRREPRRRRATRRVPARPRRRRLRRRAPSRAREAARGGRAGARVAFDRVTYSLMDLGGDEKKIFSRRARRSEWASSPRSPWARTTRSWS